MPRRNQAGRDIAQMTHAEKVKSVTELRLMGMSYQEIGDRLGMSRANACKLFKKAVDMVESDAKEGAREVLHGVILKIDRMILALSPAAHKGDAKSVREIRNLLDQKLRILGLSTPDKVAFTDPTGTVQATFGNEIGGIAIELMRLKREAESKGGDE
ncbi:MAG: hypothetical protein WCS28_12090 [Thiomicrospira sp.]|jgi:hypothetical protein